MMEDRFDPNWAARLGINLEEIEMHDHGTARPDRATVPPRNLHGVPPPKPYPTVRIELGGDLLDATRVIRCMAVLERRGVVTTDPTEVEECCGAPRDDDGFCIHRPGHPIYVGPEPRSE